MRVFDVRPTTATVKFDGGSNFVTWRRDLYTILDMLDLVDALDPTPERASQFASRYPDDPRAWSNACSAAQYTIWGSLSPRVQSRVATDQADQFINRSVGHVLVQAIVAPTSDRCHNGSTAENEFQNNIDAQILSDRPGLGSSIRQGIRQGRPPQSVRQTALIHRAIY